MKGLMVILYITLIISCFCVLYDTFVYKRKVYEKEQVVQVSVYKKGDITYLVFLSPEGQVHPVNYTLDSADYEMRKKFDN